jgi:hypothetical protein
MNLSLKMKVLFICHLIGVVLGGNIMAMVGNSLFLFLIKRIVSILPMYIDSLGIFPFNLKVARIIGANNPPRIVDPTLKKRCIAEILESALRYLLLKKKCDVVSFGPLSDNWQEMPVLMDAASHWPKMISTVNESFIGVYSCFMLPASFEAYESSLSKKERKKYCYESRYLKKHFDVDSQVLKDPVAAENEFKKFEKMHTKQWQEEGRPGHFKAWPNAEDFNIELTRIFAGRGRLRLFKHSNSNASIAYQYTFVFGNTYYWQLPARNIESQWKKYSLGSIGVIDMIKTAIDEGITKIEAGIGHYDYKIKLGAQEYPASVIRIAPNRFASKLRLFLFRGIYYLVDVFYYKIWYQRLQPRLPAFFQRPIWKLWIDLSF